MRKRKWPAVMLAVLLTIVFILTVTTVFADDIDYNYVSITQTLYITGTVNMDNYENANDTPWSSHLNAVKHVVIEDGVKSVGAMAFAGASELESVELADTVTAIGANAFASCPKLLSLPLGVNITSIADISFAYNGAAEKQGFTVNTEPGCYALYYAYTNNIGFDCDDVRTGTMHVVLQRGTVAYYPYTAKYSGSYRFYSISKHDTIGYVYNSSRMQIAYNDDHGSGYPSEIESTDFGITVSLTKGETYYLAVKIFNPSLNARFDVYFEPVSYTVSGTVCAMNSPEGDASDIPVANATINGVPTDNGSFTFTFNGLGDTVSVAADGVEITHTFRVDDGDSIVLTMMMCDVNGDGIVNAKDYAIMQRNDSPYLSLFPNFINYKY